MNPRPSRRESSVDCILTGSPSTSTLPWSGAWAPARILISVDFPAPLAPTRPCTTPLRKVTETSSRAVMLPNVLVTPDTRTRGGASEELTSACLDRVGVRGHERVVVGLRDQHGRGGHLLRRRGATGLDR